MTVTGPPGVGKTRLALELAASRAAHTVFVDLGTISDRAFVERALASALSVQEVPGRRLLDAVVARLLRRPELVLLDNCEHVAGACGQVVEVLLGGCPKLSVLATSREPLALGGERAWTLSPLPVPASGTQSPELLTRCPSVCLFVERARAAAPAFSLNSYVAAAVAEICRRLDGIPLAIELAAARADVLTAGEIAQRLDDRFDVLVEDLRSAGGYRTLAAALDWSYELLAANERALLRRLSVFVGGFTLEAAGAVCSDSELKHRDVQKLLATLVSKSLVAVSAGSPPGNGTRYRLLQTVRAYAGERLRQTGEARSSREAHAHYFVGLAETAEPELAGTHQTQWLDRLQAEHENLRAAADWTLSQQHGELALRLAAALVLFWRGRCHFSEGRVTLDSALSLGTKAPPALRARALWGAGFLTMMAGDNQAADELLEESLRLFRMLGDAVGCARALMILANARQASDPRGVIALLEESMALARSAEDSWCLTHSLALAGFDYLGRVGDHDVARGLFEESVQLARRSEEKHGMCMGLTGLGSVSLHQGDFGSAEAMLTEALAIAGELNEDYGRAGALESLGWLALERGEYSQALDLLSEALTLVPEVAPPEALLFIRLLMARTAHAAGDRPGARRSFAEALARLGTPAPFLALQWTGELSAEEGDVGEGRRLLEAALAAARSQGHKDFTARALHELGGLARLAEDPLRAARLHSEALVLQRDIGAVPALVASLEAFAGLAVDAGCHRHAGLLLSAATAQRERIGYPRLLWQSARCESDIEGIRANLGRAECKRVWAAGEKLSLDEAVSLALKGWGRRERPSTGWVSLTAREHEVAELAADGLTNPEIAERLVITRNTVKYHLSRVFTKLGVERRGELTKALWHVTRGDDASPVRHAAVPARRRGDGHGAWPSSRV